MTSVAKKAILNSVRKTRSLSKYFLIGNSKESVSGMKLPTIGQIFQYVLHVQEISLGSHPVKSSIFHAVGQVFPLWLMPGIKTLDRQYTEGKFFNLWSQ